MLANMFIQDLIYEKWIKINWLIDGIAKSAFDNDFRKHF